MVFVDTNVFVYARDEAEPSKRDRAVAVLTTLWQNRTGRVSHQVLIEFYAIVTRKLKPGLSRDLAAADVRELAAWHPVTPSLSVLEAAWQIEEQYGLSWWDSLIVGAALASSCATLLSEDLQDGLEINGLRVVNPFHPAFDTGSLTRAG